MFGSTCLFVIGASRFKYRQYNILFLIMSMTLGVGLAGGYHMPNRCGGLEGFDQLDLT